MNYNCNYCHCNPCCCKLPSPSYGSFGQSNFVTVKLDEAFPFNYIGATTPDIILTDTKTIKISKAGVYQIYYRVAVSVSANDNPRDYVDQRISIYVNGTMQPDTQGSFGILAPDINSCVPISGQAILSIPENATIQLKNDGIFGGSSAITTCDNGVNAVTINIVKLD